MRVMSKNKKPHTLYEINGEKHTITEWCKICNIPYQVVRRRLQKGYYLEEALTEKYESKEGNNNNGIVVVVNGVKYSSLRKLAFEYGLDAGTVLVRYRKGLRGEDLIKPTNYTKKKRG